MCNLNAFMALSRKSLLSGLQETVCSLRFAAKVNACETAARGGAKRNVQTGAPDADAAVRSACLAPGVSCYHMPECRCAVVAQPVFILIEPCSISSPRNASQAARRQSLAGGAALAGKRKAAAPPVAPGRAARLRLH